MSIRIFVMDLPEFQPLIAALEADSRVVVRPPVSGYWTIEAGVSLRLFRKEMGLTLALWYSMLAGGFCGRVEEYGRNELAILDEDAA